MTHSIYGANTYTTTVTADSLVTSAYTGVISTNTTLNVPATYADIHAALTYLNDKFIAANATVTIQVADGTYAYSSAISILHPCGLRIQIVGNASVPANCVINFASGIRAMQVWDGNHLGWLNGFTLNGTDNAVGVTVSDGSFLLAGSGLILSNWTTALRVEKGCYVYANSIQCLSNTDTGIYCDRGSYIDAASATSSNNTNYGFYATKHAAINANGATVVGNGTDYSPALDTEGNLGSWIFS